MNRTKNYVDFSIIREEFSKYKLQNGIVFRLKVPIVAITETVDGNKGIGKAATGILSYTEIPDSFNTSQLTSVDSSDKLTRTKKLRIVQREEIESIYETESGLIIVGLHLKNVFLTDKIDPDGNPILSFDHSLATLFIDKPTY